MSVLSSLSIRHKFALVGALALATAAVPAAGWMHGLWTAMQQSRVEQAGLPLGDAMIQVARLTARHRGLTNGALAGNADAEAQRARTWQALQALRAPTLATFQAFGDADLLKRVASNWQDQAALTDAIVARGVPAPEAFARHTALIDRELGVLSDVAVRAGLVMHKEHGGYQLQEAALNHLPLVAELMGRVRGRGMGVLSSGAIEPGARAQVAALVDRIAATSSGGSRAIALALDADPALRPSLGQAASAAQAALDETLALARRAIVDADAPTVAPADWWSATTKAIDLQLALGDAAKQALDGQIAHSVDAAQATLAGGLVLMAALAAAAVLLSIHITRATARSIDDAIALADAVAAGDLRVAGAEAAGDARVRDEGARLRAALVRMAGELREVVGGVRDNAAHVATASAQIADGNQDLSSRTESQAGALQQTAAAMEELRSTTGASAENAQQAAALARRAREVAEAGGASVGDLVGTMEQISDSARRMQDIVATIDGLAFQTNILALNAAVEAARAGEQGRGFAVVAGEVRALAQRSGAAAREIRGLIAASEERVAEGSAKGGRVRETMGDMVSSIGRVAELIIEVSAATQEQARGIAQVGEAVTQMDRHTQQNAALVEESAAAAESLRRQAGALQGSVERFRLGAQDA